MGDAELLSRIAALEAELSAAREDNRLLRGILTHAPVFLCHITLDGRILFINRFVEGASHKDIVDATIYDFTEPTHHEVIRSTIARTVETLEAQSYETIAIGDHRKPVPYFTRVAPMFDDAGNVQSVILISTEVTRIKEAEARLAESQAMLAQVLAATGMGMWWWDLETQSGGRDERTGRILGFDPAKESPSSAALDEQQHPDDRQRVRDEFANAIQTGVYGPIEHRVVRRDGEVRWVHASGRVIRGPSGNRLVGGVVDLTERKRLEEQLAQAQKLESIGRLAGGIAHDFNNMLTAIGSYTDFAIKASPKDSAVARDLAQVRAATDRSVALTSQLLAFARRQFIEPTLADLDEIVQRVYKLLRRVLGENIEVVTLLDSRAPVKVDVTQFEQVLLNLATNARDAMPDGGRLTIETRLVELDTTAASAKNLSAGTYVLLSVADTGEGIPAHLLPRVFEPFFTTKSGDKGTGLGLATCYGVVIQNRGHILVESAVDTGTTFSIYLPRAEGVVLPSEPVREIASSQGSETVLVVEDEPSVRALTVRTLEQAGYRVLVAGNGSEALALAGSHAGSIELLVTDVVMPHIGGPQLAKSLLQERPDLAILFVSGYTDSDVFHQGMLEGDVDLMQKPFAPMTLAARVRQALDRRVPR